MYVPGAYMASPMASVSDAASGMTGTARRQRPRGKAALRVAMRDRRARLSPAETAAAGADASRRLRRLAAVAEARCLGVYGAERGEVPLDALLARLGRATLTLPRVAGDRLEFVAWRPGERVARGAFGIAEPVAGEVVDLADHDVVLVPVVAFDERCRRLGQGGGFYDRALAGSALPGTALPGSALPGSALSDPALSVRALTDPDLASPDLTGRQVDAASAAAPAGPEGESAPRAVPETGPIAVGVAHWFQRVARVPTDDWDVALDAVVTDRETLISPQGRLA